MKNKQYLWFLISFCFVANRATVQDLLTVAVMTDNQAIIIDQILQPWIDAGITNFIILDNHSHDCTIAIARTCFQRNNVDHYVIESVQQNNPILNKNYALQLAKDNFSSAWLCIIDGYWHVKNIQKLLNFCQQVQDDTSKAYALEVLGYNFDFFASRLIPLKDEICFKEEVLEKLSVEVVNINDSDIYVEIDPIFYQLKVRKNYLLQEQQFLLSELKKGVESEYLLWLIACNYFNLADCSKGIEYFKKFIAISNDQDRVYQAHCKLAQLYFLLNDQKKLIEHYLTAYQIFPNRADSLIRLAQYFYDIHDIARCYNVIKQACSISYPEHDSFAERWLYDFVRYHLASASAYECNDYEFGLYATRKALQTCPELQYLYDNLDAYESIQNQF